MTNVHLVLLETSGNQPYIFDTNRLRENVGASELTHRAGTTWVLEAVKDAGGPDLLAGDSETLANNLKDRQKNPPIEDGTLPVEVVVATSGKALLLVRERERGEKIVRYVTLRALKDAPGLDVRGAVSKVFEFRSADGIGEAVTAVHREHERLRGDLPSPASRFLRLPPVASCSSSGLPAARSESTRGRHGQEADLSAVSFAKHNARDAGLGRIRDAMADSAPDAEFLDRMTEDLEWLAVVHADGNGLGQVFLDFASGAREARQYIDQLRAFSLALDACTRQAFGEAVEELQKRPVARKWPIGGCVPVLPLVLGGDDLTVVCDGKIALRLAAAFLTKFEDLCGRTAVITEVLERVGGVPAVSACAGIAIVKPHFPFHAAYDLAEELLRSAKVVKKKVPVPCSALDFHILYDASGSDLVSIREALTLRTNGSKARCTHVTARPYVTSPAESFAACERDVNDWVSRRAFERLSNRVESIRRQWGEDAQVGSREPLAEGERIPNSQLHTLREGLFLDGGDVADRHLDLIARRYKAAGIEVLYGQKPSLFWVEAGERCDETHRYTGLLDAMDAAGFWD